MIEVEHITVCRLRCDCCNTAVEEEGLSDIFEDANQAELEAAEQGWLIKRGRHLCPYCRQTFENQVWKNQN